MEIIKKFDEDKIITKVIHLSDIHIRTGNKTISRYVEYIDVIEKLISKLKEYEYENTIVIITGDLFHNKNTIESYGIDIFNKLIIELTNLTTIYIIRGNHDYRQDYIGDIGLISALVQDSKYKSKYNNLHFLDETGLYEIGDILVGLVAIQDTLKEGDTSGRVEELPNFPWTNKKYKHTIALYHGIVIEKENSIYKDPIKIKWLENYDFGLLGDIHRQEIYNSKWNKEGYYEIKDKNKIMWGYSGSLIQQNFNELINKHGYLLWDLDNYRVYSVDIANKNAYCNLTYNNNTWHTNIIDNKFKNKEIKFDNFLKKNTHIESMNIQVKNNQDHDLNEISEILKSNNIQNIHLSNKMTNNNIDDDKSIESSDNNEIQNYNSVETWFEFVTKKITDDNKEFLDNFNWKNIIKNPESLLIDTENIPPSLLDKINGKNNTLNKYICRYIAACEEVIVTNKLELMYISWDWLLCYKKDCYFNFINMNNNVMSLKGENGFGKSSLLEIICLGLFGSSIPSRNNKQFSSCIICNKKPKGASSGIKLKFKLNDKEYMLSRTFTKKSTDNNKLEQKVGLYLINKTGDTDNLVSLKYGSTAVSIWIKENVGEAKTFFQSCMHTQNSDCDLFSMSYNDQKDLMDNSLSLQSVNILIEIFKKTRLHYSTIIEDITTLDNEIKQNHKIIDKEQLGILHNECTNLDSDIDKIDNEIQSKKFPVELKESDIELDEDEIKTEIKTYEDLIKDKKFENISKVFQYAGQLLSLIKHYKSNFKYYNIDYNNIDFNDGNTNSRNILWDDITSNIGEICERVLSTDLPTIKDIKKESKLIESYFSNNLEDENFADISTEDKDKLEKLKKDNIDKIDILNNEIKQNLLDTNGIIIQYSKEELLKHTKKLEKMNKKYDKNELLLKNNIIHQEFFKENISKLESNNKEILYTKNQITKIKENDYPFNPDCECCMKQPWKIQLNDLQDTLSALEKNNSNIQNLIKEREEEIENNLEEINKNIEKYNDWFVKYKELKKNEKEYNKQLKSFELKDKLELEYNEKNTELNKLLEDLNNIEKKLDKIYIKLEYQSWVDRKDINLKHKTEYKLYIEEKKKEWIEINDYHNYLQNEIKQHEENNKNQKLFDYWSMILSLKPEWNIIKNKKRELKSKRKYLQNITNKYLTLKKSYDIYVDECKKIENYENILRVLKHKQTGVEILSEMFNDYRVWLYKEKLFPLVLRKINLIIQNMCKYNELLKLDIVWNNDTFYWFVIHNDNKIVFNKASGYQRFIISLSMRITLSSIGVSSLKCNQLFIDEGFSTCDQEHLNKIPTFLNSLLDIYNSVLVVSHIQEIKSSTTSSYDIKRDNGLSYIEYGENKNNELINMLKVIKSKS